MRKLSHVRKLWDGILELRSVTDVFTDQAIDGQKDDVDHFIIFTMPTNFGKFLNGRIRPQNRTHKKIEYILK